MNTAYDVTPSEASQLLETFALSRIPVLLLGAPGLGKSTIVKNLGVKHDRPVHDIRLAYHGPQDLAGLPYLERVPEAIMRFAQMGLLPTQPGSILFLDEILLAARMTTNCAMQITLDGKACSYTLPDDTWIFLASNRREDQCFSEKLSPALANRLAVLRVKPDLDAWVEWAFGNEIDPMVIAYVRFNPASLLDFNPTTWDGESNFASPRSWEALNRALLHMGHLNEDLRRAAVCSVVGPAAGSEFSAYLEVYRSLPSFESILLDPEHAPVPEEASARIASVAMVSNNVREKTLAPCLAYLRRFEKPFEAFAVKATLKRDPLLIRTKEIIRWCADNKDVFTS